MSTVNINCSLLPYCPVIKYSSLSFFTFQPFSSIFLSCSSELLIGTAGESAAGGSGLSGASCTVLCMSSKWDRWPPCRGSGLWLIVPCKTCLFGNASVVRKHWSAGWKKKGPCTALHHVIQCEWRLVSRDFGSFSCQRPHQLAFTLRGETSFLYKHKIAAARGLFSISPH